MDPTILKCYKVRAFTLQTQLDYNILHIRVYTMFEYNTLRGYLDMINYVNNIVCQTESNRFRTNLYRKHFPYFNPRNHILSSLIDFGNLL